MHKINLFFNWKMHRKYLLPVNGERSKKSVATLLSNVNNLPKRLVNLYFFKHSKIPASSSDLNWVKTSFLSEFNMASTRVQAMKFAYNMFKFRKSYSNRYVHNWSGMYSLNVF